MDKEKHKRLEEKGWKFGDTDEFLVSKDKRSRPSNILLVFFGFLIASVAVGIITIAVLWFIYSRFGWGT